MLDRHSLLTTLSSTGFNPKSIPGLAVWLDAQDAGSFTYSTGSDVSAWADKSGNGNNAVQATGARQPLYVASGINNRPVVQFYDDATSKQLRIPNAGTLTYNPFSCYAVIRRLTDLTSNERIFGPWDITASQRAFSMLVNNIDQLSCLISTTGGAAAGSAAVASPTIAINTNYIIDTGYTGTSVQAGVNGGTLTSTVVGAPFAATGGIMIGANEAAGGYTEPFAGYIGEILFYTASLTAAQRATVIRYLFTKWGV